MDMTACLRLTDGSFWIKTEQSGRKKRIWSPNSLVVGNLMVIQFWPRALTTAAILCYADAHTHTRTHTRTHTHTGTFIQCECESQRHSQTPGQKYWVKSPPLSLSCTNPSPGCVESAVTAFLKSSNQTLKSISKIIYVKLPRGIWNDQCIRTLWEGNKPKGCQQRGTKSSCDVEPLKNNISDNGEIYITKYK